MKKLVYIVGAVLFMASCSQGKKATSDESATTPPTPQELAVENNYPASPGPVNIAESNFYFCGEVSSDANGSYFTDCATGVKLTIAKAGDYDDVAKEYTQMQPKGEKPVLGEFRGYFMPNDKGVQQLVISDITGWRQDESCTTQKNITGTYICMLPSKEKATEEMKLTVGKDYQFSVITLDLKDRKQTSKVDGSWNLLQADQANLNYLIQDSTMSHFATINYSNNTISWTDNDGTTFTFIKSK
ncbi:MAG: hypothetical protein ACRC13_11200 [Tannerellaceae bacterium]